MPETDVTGLEYEEYEENEEEIILDNDEDYPEVELTIEMIRESLGLLCKVGNGLQVAFVRLIITNKSLTNVSILESYHHLRYLDLSDNKLTDIVPIGNMQQLLTLKCDNNKLPVVGLGPLQYLQIASFSHNCITSFLGINQMRLQNLNLSFNWMEKIMDLETGMLANLRVLDMRSNRLTSLMGLNLTHLTHLYIANNKIKSLQGLDLLVGLKILHLRGNLLQKLDLEEEQNPSLEYLNIRSNKIDKFIEVKRLKCFPNLLKLVLKNNAIEIQLGEAYKMEVLIALPKLKHLDKMTYSTIDRIEAKVTRKERKTQLEKREFEDEEEERDQEEDENEEEEEIIHMDQLNLQQEEAI